MSNFIKYKIILILMLFYADAKSKLMIFGTKYFK